MLDVLAVLSDQGRRELGKLFPQLRNDFGPDKVLNRLLLLGVGVDVNLELCIGSVCMRSVNARRPRATYHKLVFLGIVGNLGDGNGARDFLVVSS